MVMQLESFRCVKFLLMAVPSFLPVTVALSRWLAWKR